MKCKNYLILIAILCVLILLSACNSQENKSGEILNAVPSPTGTRFIPATPIPTVSEETLQGTISIRHAWDERQIPALVQIIHEFQTIYPDVYFDVLYVPSQDLQARYESESLTSAGPNLLLGPAEWGPDLYKAGLVKDLSGLLSEDRLSILNQPALGTANYQDTLVSIPYSINGIVLYRNKDIITINPNTFDELIILAQTSTIGDHIGALLERSFFYSGAHLNGLGGELMDDQGLPTFNNAHGLSWLELLREFESAGPVNYFTDQDLEFFKMKKIGWIIDGTWNLTELAEAIGPENLVIDAWPSYKEGHLSGYVRSENIYLNPTTKDDDLAASLAFIEFILSPKAQTLIAQTGRIPSVTDIVLDNSQNSALLSQAITALSEGTAYPLNPEMSVYNIQMDIALRDYFEENISAEEALQRAEDAILLELSERREPLVATP